MTHLTTAILLTLSLLWGGLGCDSNPTPHPAGDAFTVDTRGSGGPTGDRDDDNEPGPGAENPDYAAGGDATEMLPSACDVGDASDADVADGAETCDGQVGAIGETDGIGETGDIGDTGDSGETEVSPPSSRVDDPSFAE